MSKVHGGQYFYQGRKLHTLKSSIDSRSIFRAADMVLAEHGDKPSASPSLLETDENGTLMGTRTGSGHGAYAYMSYGHCLNIPSAHSMIGFNGQLIEPALSAYLLGNGYRAFNPVLMRFSSPDLLSPFGAGGINSYCYCLGDPVNKTDDSGHSPTNKAPALKINDMNRRWSTARKSGWESVFTDPKSISKIQPNLSSDEVLNLALASKKMNAAVTKESNKIADRQIPMDNVFEIKNMKFNGTLPSSISARASDVRLHRIRQMVEMEEAFLALNGRSTDQDSGRRHAVIFRPGQPGTGSSRHSSTESLDTLFDENGEIRDPHRR